MQELVLLLFGNFVSFLTTIRAFSFFNPSFSLLIYIGVERGLHGRYILFETLEYDVVWSFAPRSP